MVFTAFTAIESHRFRMKSEMAAGDTRIRVKRARQSHYNIIGISECELIRNIGSGIDHIRSLISRILLGFILCTINQWSKQGECRFLIVLLLVHKAIALSLKHTMRRAILSNPLNPPFHFFFAPLLIPSLLTLTSKRQPKSRKLK